MSRLLESCEDLFGQTDLYAILGVEKSSTGSQIKRGYYRLSLTLHPDRVEEDERDEATKKFQVLGQIYSLLSDSSRRDLYDESGEVDDEIDMEQDRDWSSYWRILFKKVTKDDILKFEEEYKGSDEELKDLKDAYLSCDGDMEAILERIMCATYTDEPRYREILEECIKKKELPPLDAFTKETKKKRTATQKRAKDEAAEAEEVAKSLGLGDSNDSLRALMKKRQQSREQDMDSFFSSLEEKYAKPKSTKKKTKTDSKKSSKSTSKKTKGQ